MKNKLETVVDMLTNKELTFGCLIKDPTGQVGVIGDILKKGRATKVWKLTYRVDEKFWEAKVSGCEILGHPILIGDVLDMFVKWETHSFEEDEGEWRLLQLFRTWRDLGFKNSLQEIFEDAEWEFTTTKPLKKGIIGTKAAQRLKDPVKQALAELLIELFYNETQE